jgi:hypothetical protein
MVERHDAARAAEDFCAPEFTLSKHASSAIGGGFSALGRESAAAAIGVLDLQEGIE